MSDPASAKAKASRRDSGLPTHNSHLPPPAPFMIPHHAPHSTKQNKPPRPLESEGKKGKTKGLTNTTSEPSRNAFHPRSTSAFQDRTPAPGKRRLGGPLARKEGDERVPAAFSCLLVGWSLVGVVHVERRPFETGARSDSRAACRARWRCRGVEPEELMWSDGPRGWIGELKLLAKGSPLVSVEIPGFSRYEGRGLCGEGF
ncbi:hypothetical protein JHW43_003402 [Diplocarpon mali]|nr:hypothetical protein JHW43_003402 [Diplocarpon mali]